MTANKFARVKLPEGLSAWVSRAVYTPRPLNRIRTAIALPFFFRDRFPNDHRLGLPITTFSGQFRAKEQVTPNSEIKAKVKEDLVTTVLASVVENIDDEENSIDVQPCRNYVWKQISDRWTIVNYSLNLNKNKKQTPA